jgi:hypothetical protein
MTCIKIATTVMLLMHQAPHSGSHFRIRRDVGSRSSQPLYFILIFFVLFALIHLLYLSAFSCLQLYTPPCIIACACLCF